jgi:hypothetical protein
MLIGFSKNTKQMLANFSRDVGLGGARGGGMHPTSMLSKRKILVELRLLLKPISNEINITYRLYEVMLLSKTEQKLSCVY